MFSFDIAQGPFLGKERLTVGRVPELSHFVFMTGFFLWLESYPHSVCLGVDQSDQAAVLIHPIANRDEPAIGHLGSISDGQSLAIGRVGQAGDPDSIARF